MADVQTNARHLYGREINELKRIVASMIDHAILKPAATDAELERECGIAAQYGVKSVCVKPSHVKKAVELLSGRKVLVGTVIGFPHGTTTTACKVAESVEAMDNGAAELDMVLNVGKLLSDDLEYVIKDIRSVVEVAKPRNIVVKVILETCYLSDMQKEAACRLCMEAGADFVKTSTGFGTGGATLEDVKLMKRIVGDTLQVKASGGIRTLEDCMKYMEAGCTRLGLSATKQILEGLSGSGEY